MVSIKMVLPVKKIKLLETSLTLDSGEILPLGFRRIAKEDGESVADNTKLELSELCSTTQDCDVFKVEALSKLSFFMSDCAATEKKANDILNTWLQEEFKKADAPASVVHDLYCMAHVLLGFHRYSNEDLTKLQKEFIAEGGKLGRDANGAYFHFKSELAVTRIVRMVSQILGPNVDEKSGIRDNWLADLSSRHQKSVIGDYRDNRFNGLFELSSQIMVQIDDILSLEKRLNSPNLKVKSVFLDLKDSRVVTMVQALGIIYVKITEPYWRLVTSKDIPYLSPHEFIQPLLKKVEDFVTDPELLLNDDEIIPSFHAIDDSIFYKAVMNIRHHDRMDILLRVISTAMGAFARCIRKQLSDILEGKYSKPASASDLERTLGSGLTNLTSERNFGSLDASQKHATLHFHSSVLLLKSNRMKLTKWILKKPKKERTVLMARAKIQGKWLRAKHKQEEAYQKKKEERELQIIEAEKKRKAAKKLLQKARSSTSKKISGSTIAAKKSKATRHRVALPQPPEVVKSVKVSDWVAVAFDNGVCYPGRVISLDTPGSLKVDYMHPSSTSGVYRIPSPIDIGNVDLQFIFCTVKEAPIPIAGGRLFMLPNWKETQEKFKTYERFYF